MSFIITPQEHQGFVVLVFDLWAQDELQPPETHQRVGETYKNVPTGSIRSTLNIIPYII